MSSRVSLRQKLIGHLEDADSILRDILTTASRKKGSATKEIYKEMEVYNDIQKKIDLLRADCSKSDKQIQACQLQLKKTEVILSLWEAFSDTAAAAASITVSSTPSVSSSSGPNSFPNQNVGASQNPTYHSSQPQPTSFSLVTCSPNMVLPGVNMVSSPISVSQSTASAAWAAPNTSLIAGNSTTSELTSPQASISRPPSTSLAAMLTGANMMDPHSRSMTLPPPPLKPVGSQIQVSQPTSFRPNGALPRQPSTGVRQALPSSPTSSGSQQIQYSYSDTHSSLTPSNKPSRAHSKPAQRKHTGTEYGEMSSNSSSDSSSGEE
ncbi:unnamed protein product [Heterobilharzia americana]|nr:unnamed protein product [Heterobilharzia americana]